MECESMLFVMNHMPYLLGLSSFLLNRFINFYSCEVDLSSNMRKNEALSFHNGSLLRSRFWGCHATLPPKKRLLTSKQHSFPKISQSRLPFHLLRTFLRQLSRWRLVQSDILFYLHIIWWESHKSTSRQWLSLRFTEMLWLNALQPGKLLNRLNARQSKTFYEFSLNASKWGFNNAKRS